MANLTGVYRTTIAYQALGSGAWEPMFTESASGTPLIYLSYGTVASIISTTTQVTNVNFINASTKGTITFRTQTGYGATTVVNRNPCPVRPSSRTGLNAGMVANRSRVLTGSTTFIDSFSANPKPGDANLVSGTQTEYGSFPTSLDTGQVPFALCNSTRAIWGPTGAGALQYIEIASGGAATSFGTLNNTRNGGASAASTTRGIMAGGISAGTTIRSDIDYITIASTGNSVSFGALTTALYQISGASNSTRAIFRAGRVSTATATTSNYSVTPNATGNTPGYTIAQTITIASTGNATTWASGLNFNFGSCAAATPILFYSQGGAFYSGANGFAVQGGIFINFASSGNYSDWPVINQNNTFGCATSNCHGGL